MGQFRICFMFFASFFMNLNKFELFLKTESHIWLILLLTEDDCSVLALANVAGSNKARLKYKDECQRPELLSIQT